MNTNRWFYRVPLGMLMIITSAAQPSVAETGAYNTYLGNRHQFTVELPEGWHVVDQSPYSDSGVIGFYSQSVAVTLDKDPAKSKLQEQAFYKLLDDMSSGALPAFFVDRYPASKGMACEQFDARAQKKKVKIYSNAHALGKKPRLIGEPEVTSISFGGCNGIKVLLSATNATGKPLRMLVYTAAANGMTYDFTLLTDAEYFEQNLPWFMQMTSSVKLTGASQ